MSTRHVQYADSPAVSPTDVKPSVGGKGPHRCWPILRVRYWRSLARVPTSTTVLETTNQPLLPSAHHDTDDWSPTAVHAASAEKQRIQASPLCALPLLPNPTSTAISRRAGRAPATKQRFGRVAAKAAIGAPGTAAASFHHMAQCHVCRWQLWQWRPCRRLLI
jgi:hypothetical protein